LENRELFLLDEQKTTIRRTVRIVLHNVYVLYYICIYSS
jgi:hypothetical protein